MTRIVVMAEKDAFTKEPRFLGRSVKNQDAFVKGR